ncbi:DUF1906 domain-containing protein [Actinomadura livida]|uniref:Rv2525c-like glycoside hydrolase-like domain-containing protein n=1 Tax=Actinomadura livida TaxID=79909 RepID=A0A7W7IGQ6_9ACTN|nr:MULTISPECIES: DUF1906 domain-containing protein [Actinomadura]MBB4776650.1 hypothetical protein [Actinomadura catellatispora]GGT93832.1 hypothetical protein GCM10010208_16140 [Actinomadura livida]
MRRGVLFSVVLCGAAAAAPALAVLGTDPSRSSSERASALARDAGPAGDAAGVRASRVVEYRGLRIPVPAGWEVHDLDRDPLRCVRYDRRALYLGRPGPEPDCPARIVGRTEAVHIQPSGGSAPPAGRLVTGDSLARLTVPQTVDQELRLDLREAGVTITGVYGTDPAALQRMLRGARLTGRPPAASRVPETSRTGAGHESPGPREPGPLPPSPSVAEPARPDTPRPGSPRPGPSESSTPRASGSQAGAAPAAPKKWVRGKGFDTCAAPSIAAMKAWRPSFKVTNIYIGGAARGCAQPNLTERWVREVREMGYRITPTYVGLQAPCGSRPQRFTAKNAASQGRKAAVDAAGKAGALGIPAGAPIYFDMEAYAGRKKACKAAVLRFVDNWVRRLKVEGYTPCLYSSVTSGIRDVGRATGIGKPECVWFAHWNGKAQVYGDPFIPDDWWRPHRRIKQYRGDHYETHGGVTLNIDGNIADGLAF